MKRTIKMLEVEERIGEPIEDFLRREYLTNKKTLDEVANILGFCQRSISNWMERLQISRRDVSSVRLPEGVSRLTKDELQKRYTEQKLSSDQIAEQIGVSGNTILSWLKQEEIPVRTSFEARLPEGIIEFSRGELEEMYIKQGMSTIQIAKIRGIHDVTVCKKMDELGITRRKGSKARLRNIARKLSEKELRYLYQELDMSCVQIAKDQGVSSSVVNNWLQEYQIPRRSISEVRLSNGARKPSKEELKKLYIEMGLNSLQIAPMFGVHHSSIRKWISQYEIPTRGSAVIKTPNQFSDILHQDPKLASLVVAAGMLNGHGADIEKIILEVYDGRFKNPEELHSLVQNSYEEARKIISEGRTNLGHFVGDFTISESPALPVFIEEAVELIPIEKLSGPIEDRFVRVLRYLYSPRFNDDPQGTLEELTQKIAPENQRKSRGLYERLYDHYSKVVEAMG
jgi:transposase